MNEFKIAHFGISVKDIDRAVEWYRDNFGFEEEKRFEKPDLEIKGAVMTLGSITLEILAPYTPQTAGVKDDSLVAGLRRIGANHFALCVDDIASFYRELKDNKVQLVTDIIDNRLFFCKDPDDTLIEIKQG